MIKPTHAWCNECGKIQPLLIHEVGEKDVNNKFFNPTDFVCKSCRYIIMTRYTDKP